MEMQSTFTLVLVVFVVLVFAGVGAGSVLGMQNAPKAKEAPEYDAQNTDTQKATTNQANDSVKADPK